MLAALTEREYDCPELGPCPFCGKVMYVRQYTTVWDRDQFPDGTIANNKAGCGACSLELRGYCKRIYSNNPVELAAAFQFIKLQLLERWSYRQENRTFTVSEAEFKQRPEEVLGLRVYGNVSVIKKDAPRTAAPLMVFEQLVG